MRKISNLLFQRTTVLVLSSLLFITNVHAQTTITTLPNPPYNGGNSAGTPSQITFVIENSNSGGIFLTGISNWCLAADNNSIWELYYTASALSGPSTNVTIAPWTLVATSQLTSVVGTGITPINFAGLSFFIPGNTQYRFALRATGPGTVRYSGTGTAITPNTFSDGGVNLLLGDFQIAGANVGLSGPGTGLTNNPRYFTGSITFEPATACTGVPLGGAAQSSINAVCNPTTPFVLSVTGSTSASGLTYQWQRSADNIAWTDIASATTSTLSVTGISANTYYRRRINCGVNSANSVSTLVTVTAVSYTTLPFTESFENNWLDACDTRDVPNNFWRNTPVTGNNSWRRNDDAAAANWVNPALGPYTPTASVGTFSARFHSYQATSGTKGQLDLFVNGATGLPTKRLSFDFINTSGNDSLVIFVSTNGGTTFTRLDSVRTSTVWKNKRIVFTSSSATTVIRFEATSDFGVTDFGLDNINVADVPNCTGTPAGGSIIPATPNFCNGIPFTLTVTGSLDPSAVGNLTFQWQQSPDGITWTNIAGATGETYSSAGISVNTQFRRQITCSGNTSNSTVAAITIASPAYAPMPFAESFENTWASICDTRDVPNNFWRNNPVTGFNSWRRNDDGIPSGAWTNNLGPYTPDASAGIYSARFHSYQASSGTKGQLNLYLNASTASPSKRLSFDYINTTGNDSLVVYFSTNGGASFTRLDSVRTSTIWKTKQIVFTSTSSTTVIRFEATSDFGVTDIGLDNINIVDFPNCTGTPTGGTIAPSAATICPATAFTLSVTGGTDANGITYQWQQSIDGGTTWTNIATATAASYTSAGITVPTSYRRQILCGAANSFSTIAVLTLNAPVYIALPYAESFEATWINGCGVRDIPNNSWRNVPVTGNNSWRRDDDPGAANWTLPNNGEYTPDASDGLHSARFHSYEASSGTKGQFNLHINAATASATKRLNYDFINTSGTDTLSILLSTNGGTTFTRIDSARTSAFWRTKSVVFTSSSATTIIRFETTSDFGVTDIGLDNIFISDFADCAGLPTAGSAQSSSTTVCGEQFTLSLSGSSSAAGIVYQWQRSTDNVNFTNIAGATNFTLTTSQTVTTFYRAVVTCSFTNETSNSASVQVISPALVSGTFAINNALPTNIAASTFNNFNDAYNHIRCGINGAVVFNVVDNVATIGTYNEQLIMTRVPGASIINTVTFKGRMATIAFASTNTNERAVIKLRGADYIRFDSLIINAGAGTFGYGVQLIADADSNIVSNCIINNNTAAITTNYAGIVINGTEAGPIGTGTVLCDGNIFSKNTITGGYAGITLNASLAGANGNNQYLNNVIKDFYIYGMYVGPSYGTILEGNSISRPTRTAVTTFYGVYFTGISTNARVSKNKISNPFTGAPTSTSDFNGIYFTGVDATITNENFVTNNLIYDVDGAGEQYGIYNSSSDNVWYLHNTIALNNVAATATSLTRGFYQITTAGGIIFFNNNITIGRGGTGIKHAFYRGTAASGITADYNNYFINAAAGTNFIGFLTSNRATLADWQAATGDEANSLSRNPLFALSTADDYKPTNGAVDNKGLFANITTDILNVTRSTSTPDVGAFEFAAPPCAQPPLPGNTLFSDTTVCQNSPVRLNLTLTSWGNTQTFQWQTATTAAGPWTNISGLLSDPDTTIVTTTTLFYRAAVTCGVSTVFSNPLQMQVSPALPAGTYTINRTGTNTYVPGIAGGNFISFNDAKAAMSCGIFGGPVVFNVVPGTGTYNEQLRLDSIAGTSAVNTITFNGNGNTISFNVTTTAERAIVKLSGADHIIFDSLRIDASAGTFGYGVQLINNADSNIFRRNTIISSTTATTTNYAGVVINATEAGPTSTGNTLSDGNKFDRNTIIGGNSGITVVGGTTAPLYINDNQFTNNNISEFYTHGIYVAGTYNNLIEGNNFSRPTRATTAANVYGIFATAVASNRLTISKNRFFNFFRGVAANTATFHAVYSNSVDATTGSEVMVTNNLVYGNEGNAPMYGFYNLGSNNIFYFHNTISFDNGLSTATGQTAGLYQTTAATGVHFRNNIVTIRRGGTGNKHGIYMATVTGTEITASNNDYFIAGANAHVGFRTTNQTTLAQWQAASTQDANSFDLNPLYTDTLTGNYRPQLTAINDKGVALGITTDILNATRSNTTPDLGAYEFAAIACQSPPVAGTATVTPSTGICLEVPIQLNITGHSPLGNITFQWQNSVDGTTWTNLGSVQFFPDLNTIATVNRFYRAAVTCNGVTTFTNTVSVNLNPLLLAGTYTIDPALPAGGTNFQSFQAAVTAMLCGITGPVVFNVKAGTYNEQIRIPYIPNTNTVNTVIFQSGTGVASSVNLSAAGTVTNNYTLRLDSTRYFTFRNMSFTGTDVTNGRAVELFNEASNNNFTGNIINVPAVTTASTSVAGIYANAFRGRNILLNKNTINNGSRGIHFTGTSAAVLANAGHVIDSNVVNNAYNYGIYTEFTQRLRVTNNTVSHSVPTAAASAGIYANFADSAFRLTGNTVMMNNNTATSAYGLYVLNTRAVMADSSIVASNRFMADSNNTGTVYGITISTSKNLAVINNVVALNSAGATAYGLWSLNNTETVNYYNNSINVAAASANGYAGYFNHAVTGNVNVANSIFSNKGGGNALFINNPSNFNADYNMLYSSGANLVQVATGATLNFATLKAWTNTWNWDRYSIGYAPAFISNSDLRPNLASPDVWAMHGRGTQILGNSYDFNNAPRPQTLRTGVPDLGAYEFFPTAQPTVLLATPAVPAPNSTQIFSYGTDTVMRITWGPTAPPTVSVRRFSGVVPTGLLPTQDSMYFYTKVDVGGTNNYQYSTKLYYINPWQGSIPQQFQIGLGRTTPSNAWVVGQNSKVDVGRKEISQDAIVYLDRFTGLVNPFAQIDADDSTSNRGKDFWVGYQRTNGFDGGAGGGQNMVIYMGAGDVPANVTITIEGTTGTPWVRNYTVPANTTLTSEIIPKTGADDARLVNEGQYNKKGIHITSNVPIVAYAHIYESANSGATMLLPTTVWGYEYYTLQSRQNYTSTSYSAYHIVAQHDSTWVEINPSAPTRNGWMPNGGTQPNGSYLVKLNKGDAFQVLGAILSGSEGYDLTGSYIKSIAGSTGCYPIAVFAGSTRTGIGCGTSAGGSGDLILQQIFPYQAWGTKYATAPTTNATGPTAASNMTNVFRVMVKDPTTVVRRNGIIIPVASLINSRYYQFESNIGEYIESNKPVLVAQYMSSSGSCPNTTGNGDPEMFYLSPIEQAIKKTQFYRNNLTAITTNYITLIVPTEGLNSLRIDGINYLAFPVADRLVTAHPSASLPGYSIVTKRWTAGSGSSTVESDLPFTGIVYGIGSVESYGYNLGTLVKNLNNLSSVNTTFNTGANPTEYTCKGAPFRLTALLPIVPDSIRFVIAGLQRITPNTNVTLRNPIPTDTVDVNGVQFYAFTLSTSYTLDSAGTFNIPVQYWSPEIESCDKMRQGSLIVQVLPKPITNFQITYAGAGVAACAGDVVNLSGDIITSNGIALNQWQWTYAPGGTGGTASGQNQTISYAAAGTYAVTLRGITADGCISDTTRNIVFNARPVVTVVNDNITACPGDNITFTVSNPIAGATYRWYTAATAGTLLGTGTSYTATNAVLPLSIWVEGTANTCVSASRKEVRATTASLLAQPVATFRSSTPNSITFGWNAVAGATGYEVSVGGAAFTTPSSGATGLTHIVSNLRPLDTVSIRVRALGALSCQAATSIVASGRTVPDQIYIPNSFTPNGDGLNDRLLVYGYVIREIRFTVFNQWGEKIFESNAQASGWDGMYKGKAQPSGVYIYVAKFVLLDGTTTERKGSINLVR